MVATAYAPITLADLPALKLVRAATLTSQAVFITLSDFVWGDITIKKGTEYDGASLPRWVIMIAMTMLLMGGLSCDIVLKPFFAIGFLAMLFGWAFPPFGTYAIAALIHDEYYHREEYNLADQKLEEVLQHLPVGNFHAYFMYRFVKLNSAIKNYKMGA